MATVPSVIPEIGDAPAYPTRAGTTDKAAYLAATATADSRQQPYTDEQNASISAINEVADVTYDNALEAASSAVESQGYANQSLGYSNDANDYSQIALGAANYVGLWADQTGSLDKPASVFHSGNFWVLNNNLADVTASEPSRINADWQLLSLFQTQQPSVSSDTATVNENDTTTVNITNYEPELTYTVTSTDPSIVTGTESGGVVTIAGGDITDGLDKSATIQIQAKATGIPISDSVEVLVTVLYVPIVADDTLQVTDFTGEALYNDGYDLI